MSGTYPELGQQVRQARLRLGWSRDKLARFIAQRRTLDVTLNGARFMVRELEDDGTAMNPDVVRYIVELLEITYP